MAGEVGDQPRPAQAGVAGPHAASAGAARVLAEPERGQDVLGGDRLAPAEVGDRPGDAHHPVHPARAERLALVGLAQALLRAVGQPRVSAKGGGVHVPVAGDPGPCEAAGLSGSRSHDPLAHPGGARAGRRRQMRSGRALQGAQEVDAVEQRAAQPAPVPRDVALRAAAAARIPGVAARAWIGRRHEHEPGGKRARPLAAHDRRATVLERLAQSLQGGARELRQLVEEQDAVVGQARLARHRPRAAADQPGGRDRVVRRAEGAAGDQPAAVVAPRDAVDARHLQRLLSGQRRQDARQAPRQHRLADARRALEEQVVTARRRDLHGVHGLDLAGDVAEVGVLARPRAPAPRAPGARPRVRRRAAPPRRAGRRPGSPPARPPAPPRPTTPRARSGRRGRRAARLPPPPAFPGPAGSRRRGRAPRGRPRTRGARRRPARWPRGPRGPARGRSRGRSCAGTRAPGWP